MTCPSSRTRIPESGRSSERTSGGVVVTVDSLHVEPVIDSSANRLLTKCESSLAAKYMGDSDTSTASACDEDRHDRPARWFQHMRHTDCRVSN